MFWFRIIPLSSDFKWFRFWMALISLDHFIYKYFLSNGLGPGLTILDAFLFWNISEFKKDKYSNFECFPYLNGPNLDLYCISTCYEIKVSKSYLLAGVPNLLEVAMGNLLIKWKRNSQNLKQINFFNVDKFDFLSDYLWSWEHWLGTTTIKIMEYSNHLNIGHLITGQYGCPVLKWVT